MVRINPKSAVEANRYAKTAERAKTGEFTLWPMGGGIVTVDSWKTVDGKRTFSRYEVNMHAHTCTCGDFAQHRDYCKHLLRCDIAAGHDHLTEQERLTMEADACLMDVNTYKTWKMQYEEV